MLGFARKYIIIVEGRNSTMDDGESVRPSVFLLSAVNCKYLRANRQTCTSNKAVSS